MEDDLMLDYTNRFRTTFETVHRKINSLVLAELNSELTGPQLFMLFMIGKIGSPKQTALAEKMGVKPSAITVMIDRLVQSGHVIRKHHETDRRIVLVENTELGNAVLAKAEQVQAAVIARGLSKLPPAELEIMVAAFEKLRSYY
ncbi:MarR family winged helix-turn-helix transcriptional regulator [Paenibacillus sp. GCM10023248]|uniref:MarR family winged helix-turn-helix transcriptional regulator n=1 Tax=Bacillales TaxID=1385 RepID=UPI002379927A|nr:MULTISPECIES: MarR family transcriptional regulator [Bacillales]MDD9266338.1 MarR family transcriptional regulator [Paenibacillus sp. MAHUQ-63]MDR6878462.1 DNA-binding MarR family transcriptional regulator [Bacillus sp. 3255]